MGKRRSAEVYIGALGRHEPEPENEHRSRGISFVIEKYDKLTNGKGGFGKA
jgi:hypothetical protein